MSAKSARAGPSTGAAGRGGRGRGGFSRGGGSSRGKSSGAGSLPFGTLTYSDFAEADKARPNKHAYPPMEQRPVLSRATEMEKRAIHFQLDLIQAQRDTPWWPKHGSDLTTSASGHNTNSLVTAARIKRSNAHLTRYSDRLSQQYDNGNEPSAFLSFQKSDDEKSNFLDTLQREAFPAGLWQSYVEGESRRKHRRVEAAAAEQKRKRQRGDWKRILDGVEATNAGVTADDETGKGGGIGPISEADDDPDEEPAFQDEYEDDFDDDYASNYFDNGEDDDLPEDGGGGGEAEDVYE